MAVSIVIPGPPVAKGRPRFTRQGRTYTPKKSADYEAIVAAAAKAVMPVPYDEALRVSVWVQIPIPKSWTKKKRAEKVYRAHTQTPDLDNFIKAALDGMNGIAFTDDSLIAELSARKIWTEGPGQVVVNLEPMTWSRR